MADEKGIRDRSKRQLKAERDQLRKALDHAQAVDLPPISPGHELRKDLIATIQKRIESIRDELQRRRKQDDVPGVEDGGWHPDAERRLASVRPGPFAGGGRKLVWHTTEGSGDPGNYPTGGPHFTLDPRSGHLTQHISIRESAAALEHPSGTPETNRANAIQVELIGFAGQTQNWPDAAYRELADLARWIEKHAAVPRSCDVKFAGAGQARRMGGDEFYRYAGHCGHEHAANQPSGHWDPGALNIGKVI